MEHLLHLGEQRGGRQRLGIPGVGLGEVQLAQPVTEQGAAPVKQGPLLYDFKWLPKPQLVPSKAEAAAAAAGGAQVSGKKRKAADEPTANGK